MSNVNIELVVKTATNDYRTIKPGDLVTENEHVENKVVVTGDARVFWLRSKDGPGKLSDAKRKLAGLQTHFGRIFAIEHPAGFTYVWAGKNPESNEALQRIEELNLQEFKHVIGAAFTDDVVTETRQTTEPESVSSEQREKESEIPATNSATSSIKKVLKYKKELEATRAGAKLILHSDLLADFGFARAKKNNSREIQGTLEDLGIQVIPDIYRNPHSHLLLVLKSGYLQSNHGDILEGDDPCQIMQEALERVLA